MAIGYKRSSKKIKISIQFDEPAFDEINRISEKENKPFSKLVRELVDTGLKQLKLHEQ